MARITASNSFNNINPANYGFVSSATDNQWTVTESGRFGQFNGFGFAYDGNLSPTRGTVSSFRDYTGNTLNATVDQFSMLATTAHYYVSRNDMAGFYSQVLSGNDTITGSVFADRIAGYGGNDTIISGGGNDYIDGGAGNDYIYMSSGNSYVTGGTGLDFVDLPGARGIYGQAKSNEGWQFWNNSINMNVNLNSVERVAFDDGYLAFDTAGFAGQAYRLYQAAFARDPDAGGLGYWINRFDNGTASLSSASSFFVSSPEFASKYGTPSSVTNARYVELLYLNTLGRDYDQGGFNYWVGRLNNGTINRADMLANFSESPENYQQVAGEISNGIWYV